MGGWLVLIAVFCLFQAFVRRKERKETVFNWKEAAECEADQEALRQERLAMLPSRQERIQSCYESLEKLREDWANWQEDVRLFKPEDTTPEPMAVFYTHIPLDRAIVYRDKDCYMVGFQRIDLIRDDALAQIFTPGMPFGSWKQSYPNRFFDTQEEAERIAQKAMQWLN